MQTISKYIHNYLLLSFARGRLEDDVQRMTSASGNERWMLATAVTLHSGKEISSAQTAHFGSALYQNRSGKDLVVTSMTELTGKVSSIH